MISLCILLVGIIIWLELLDRYFVTELQEKHYTHELSKEISGYIRSCGHAVIVSCLAAFGIYRLSSSSTIFTDYSDVYVTTGIVSIAYFMHDLLHILKRSVVWNHKSNSNWEQDRLYMIHHICFSIFLIWTNYMGNYHYGGLILYLSELSTIVLNYFQYHRFYAKLYAGRIKNHEKRADKKRMNYHNKMTYCIFFVFTLVFIQSRIINLAILLYNFFSAMMSPVPLIISGFVVYLNGKWFISIIHALYNFRSIEFNQDSLKKDF